MTTIRTTFANIEEGDTVQVAWGTARVTQTYGEPLLFPAAKNAPKRAFWAVVSKIERRSNTVLVTVRLSHGGEVVLAANATRTAITVESKPRPDSVTAEIHSLNESWVGINQDSEAVARELAEMNARCVDEFLNYP